MADLPDGQGPVVIACNLFGLGVSSEVCWAVWIVVYALLIAFLMWMRKRDGGGWGVP